MTQRYATRGEGILSFPAASGFEIFRRGRIQYQIDGEPQHFGIADEPNPEQNRNRNHDGERYNRVSNPEYVSHDRPGTKRHHDGKAVADGDVRQEVAALSHEEVPATRASLRTIEIPAEQLSLPTDRAT